MKNKKWILLLIIAFPSLFWLILETSTIHSKKLPYYGPKSAAKKGDTLYHRVSDAYMMPGDTVSGEVALNAEEYPLYVIVFVSEKYREDSYRLAGLWEYLNYKKSKVAHIPFVLVFPVESGGSPGYRSLKKLEEHPNVSFYELNPGNFKQMVSAHFAEKPYYIDYSFFVLVDQNRNIRGYYDARYVSEIKRLIGEYQHLRLKEEKQKLIKANEIRSN